MPELLLNSGIDGNLLILLLSLPLSVSIIAAWRHIFGFKSLGMFISIFTVFVLLEFSLHNSIGINTTNGLKYGLIWIVLIFLLSIGSYALLKRWTLHYYPKLAIIVSLVTAAIVCMVFLGAYLKVDALIKINSFAVILTLAMTEKYITILARKSLKESFITTFQGTILGVLVFLLISIQAVQDIMIYQPYVFIFLLPLNYLVGRFTGLRFTEYLRFRDILDNND